MKLSLYVLLLSLVMVACGDSTSTTPNKIKDLAFVDAKSAKEYADLIIRTIRTDRDKVLFEEFSKKEGVDANKLNLMVKTYAKAIGEKRKAWEFYDNYAEEGKEPKAGEGYDYTWYDERGRIAIQLNVLPKGGSKGFELEKLEFRSRIEILNSEAFPGGPIDDYKIISSK